MQKDAIDISFSWIDGSPAHRPRAVPDVEVVDPVLVAWASSEDLRFFFAFGYEARLHWLFGITRLSRANQPVARGTSLFGRQAAEDLKKGVGDVSRV